MTHDGNSVGVALEHPTDRTNHKDFLVIVRQEG